MENLEQAANIEESMELATPDEEVQEYSPSEEVEEPTEEEKPVEDITETQAFAKRLKEATAKAKAEAADEQIARMYGQSHGIYTVAQYEEAVAKAEKEAEEKAIEDKIRAKYSYLDDEIVEELIAGKKFRERFEQKEQETKAQQEEREAKEKEDAKRNADNMEFLELFEQENGRPWKDTDGIPKEVLDYQARGKSLPHAYSRYLADTYKSKVGASVTNERNAQSSTGSVTGNEIRDNTLTEEMIENMTPRELAKRWGDVKSLLKMK